MAPLAERSPYCGLTPYNDYVAVNTFLVGSYFPLGMALLFFLLAVLVNPLILLVAPKRALRTPELAVILTMTLVACSIPSQGLLRAFIPTLVSLGPSSFWRALTVASSQRATTRGVARTSTLPDPSATAGMTTPWRFKCE